MTVCELIKCLEKCPCDAEITIKDDYNEEFSINTIIFENVLTGDCKGNVLMYI